MRVIVTGDRNWQCKVLALQVVESLKKRHGGTLVVRHGAGTGVDAAFDRACKDLDVACERHPAQWEALRKRAGPVRNSEMVALGADLCLAFHPSLRSGKGTTDCICKCILAGIPVWLTESEDRVPVRIYDSDTRLKEWFRRYG